MFANALLTKLQNKAIRTLQVQNSKNYQVVNNKKHKLKRTIKQ